MYSNLDWFALIMYSSGFLTLIIFGLWSWYQIFKDANDPVKSCEVYLEGGGCTHVDGFNCVMNTCPIRKEFLLKPEPTKYDNKCKHIKVDGASCTLNNNCTYPNCK